MEKLSPKQTSQMEAALHEQRTKYRITSIVPAVVLFFCLGVGLSFGVVLLSLGISGFDKEAQAAVEPSSLLLVPEVESVADRRVSMKIRLKEPEVERANQLNGDSDTRVSERDPHRIFANAASFIRNVAAAHAVKTASGVSSAQTTAALSAPGDVCETAHRACIDMCPDGSSGFDAGLKDNADVCKSACADGQTRCQKNRGAQSCGHFLGACRYKCGTDSYQVDDCEDACELAEASCSTAFLKSAPS